MDQTQGYQIPSITVDSSFCIGPSPRTSSMGISPPPPSPTSSSDMDLSLCSSKSLSLSTSEPVLFEKEEMALKMSNKR